MFGKCIYHGLMHLCFTKCVVMVILNYEMYLPDEYPQFRTKQPLNYRPTYLLLFLLKLCELNSDSDILYNDDFVYNRYQFVLSHDSIRPLVKIERTA